MCGDFGFKGSPFTADEFERPNQVQLGRAPNRIDILTLISGVSTDDLWKRKVKRKIDGLDVFFISKEDLIKNKESIGRLQDLADVEILKRR
ncbi:MAG: hypothetical protein D6780_05795 [Candidatus Dadabacteria bacterium]|nr:MAG: hypothetical protein D6780_05795 [Candidatus Dadabacteria bacterium]